MATGGHERLHTHRVNGELVVIVDVRKRLSRLLSKAILNLRLSEEFVTVI